MKVYKFGGASVKSADAIKNIYNILKRENADIVIVISAMNKTTNHLENLLLKYFNNEDFNETLTEIIDFHKNITNELFPDNTFYSEILFPEIEDLKRHLNNPPSNKFDKEYDFIVSKGEIFSTLITSNYLNHSKLHNTWLDARNIIKTDSNFRAAKVDFFKTERNLKETINFNKNKFYITQGFIGSNSNNEVTTLGREGSDYSAAIIANLLSAESLTLWKDVDGIYNIDPKIKSDAIKIEEISYREATELAYFGAKIIHHKTATPLMNKGIALYIRSFNNLEKKGSVVGNFNNKIYPKVPIYIYSYNQILLTISSNEFINEYHFEKIYSIFKKFKTKINLLQNSALNLSVCFDYRKTNFEMLMLEVKKHFSTKHNSDLTLITIRHYTQQAIDECTKNKNIILEQKNRLNAFFLIEN